MGRKKKVVEVAATDTHNVNPDGTEIPAGEVITNENALKVIAESLFVLTQLQHTIANDAQTFKKAHETSIRSLAEAHNILHQKITAIEEAFLKFQGMFSKPATASMTVQTPPAAPQPVQKVESPIVQPASTSNGFGL